MAEISVAVADAQPLFAEALTVALRGWANLKLPGDWSTSGRQIVRQVEQQRPDVVLIDFWIADMAGPAAARAVRQISPSTRVLFLSEFHIGPVQREQAGAAGGLWFVPKHMALIDVVDGIHAAAAWTIPADSVADDDPSSAGRRARLDTLTAREIEVLQVLRRGCNTAEAAKELAISAGTIKNHIHSILVKTKAHSQVEAMLMAEEERLISGS